MSRKVGEATRCEACNGSVDPDSECGSDPDGNQFCEDCTYDAKHDKAPRCAAHFEGVPFKPGRPLRVFICGRPRNHPGNCAAHLPGLKVGSYATVSWSPPA